MSGTRYQIVNKTKSVIVKPPATIEEISVNLVRSTRRNTRLD
ncbi:MAG: hypothetical protein QW733_01955 [Desulfurococcaceae archaeon]